MVASVAATACWSHGRLVRETTAASSDLAHTRCYCDIHTVSGVSVLLRALIRMQRTIGALKVCTRQSV